MTDDRLIEWRWAIIWSDGLTAAGGCNSDFAARQSVMDCIGIAGDHKAALVSTVALADGSQSRTTVYHPPDNHAVVSLVRPR